jgi:hypothetical protein
MTKNFDTKCGFKNKNLSLNYELAHC